jgi:N-acetylmuramoyl-L-alanine amidase
MGNYKFPIAALLLVFTRVSSAQLVVLDPGHTLQFPGVTGTCGTQEVFVNDQLALKIARLLRGGGYQVRFSREPNVDKSLINRQPGRESSASLRRRGMRANNLKAVLFISIHHDSIAEEFLVTDAAACADKSIVDAKVITPDFLKSYQVGFNIFIHPAAGRKFRRSLRLAGLIGKGFVDNGQTPSNFHVLKVEADCTSCKFVNEALGVMSRDLAVIRTPTMPAMLIEITNLRIPELERKANDPEYQNMMAEIIKRAIDQYFGKDAKGKSK